MPWLETDPMDQRTAFIVDYQRGLYRMTDLCDRYGVSRKTGYKWLARFAEGGRRDLRDRSRAPHHCPHKIDAALAELLCQTRRKHPDWGAGKLLDNHRPKFVPKIRRSVTNGETSELNSLAGPCRDRSQEPVNLLPDVQRLLDRAPTLGDRGVRVGPRPRIRIGDRNSPERLPTDDPGLVGLGRPVRLPSQLR